MLCLQSFTYFSSYPAVPLTLGDWAHSGSWEGDRWWGFHRSPAQQQARSAWVTEDHGNAGGSLLKLPPPVPPHTIPSLTSSSGLGKWRLIYQGHFHSGKPKESNVLGVQKVSNIHYIICDTLKIQRQVYYMWHSENTEACTGMIRP